LSQTFRSWFNIWTVLEKHHKQCRLLLINDLDILIRYFNFTWFNNNLYVKHRILLYYYSIFPDQPVSAEVPSRDPPKKILSPPCKTILFIVSGHAISIIVWVSRMWGVDLSGWRLRSLGFDSYNDRFKDSSPTTLSYQRYIAVVI